MFSGGKSSFFAKLRISLNLDQRGKAEIQNASFPFNQPEIQKIFDEISRIFLDPSVNEVFLNHHGDLSYFDRFNFLHFVDGFCSPELLMDLVWFLAWESKVRLDPLMPYSGGVVVNKPWRWHAVIPPAAPDGPTLVIRRQAFETLNLSAFNLENLKASDFPEWLRGGVSIVFFGPTGSGKTSLLFAIMKQYFSEVRLGIVESVVEMPLISKSWFRLVEVGQGVDNKGGVNMDRVFAEAMRLSPRLVVLGEIRLTEARVLSQLAKSGHGGVMTTMHAGASQEAKERLIELTKSGLERLPQIMGVHVRRGNDGQHCCTAEKLF